MQTPISLEFKVTIPRSDIIHLESLTRWINRCETEHWHQPETWGSLPRHKDPIDLILIDALRGCLVRRQSGQRYCALSYVWGGTQLLQTTDANFVQLQSEGAVRNHTTLPRAVRDAMDLVTSLGERFLWVDCLCIIQDSAEKHNNITQMDIIYSQAFLTIVAVDGSNADAPLPGVHEDSRLPIVKLEYVRNATLISQPPLLLNSILDGSIYETRGWTLQERVLSKRLLYLSAQGIFFQCSHSFISEYMLSVQPRPISLEGSHELLDGYQPQHTYDTIMNGSERAALIGKRVSQHSPRTETRWLSRPNEDWTKFARWDVLLPTYQDFVEIYSARRLSYEEDVLNAFAGISAVIGQAGKTAFIDGLPEVVLASCLLWVTKADHVRRRLNKSGKPLLPSWTWAAWGGPVVYPNILRGRFVNLPGKEPLFVLPTSKPMRVVRKAEDNTGLLAPNSLAFTAEFMECQPVIEDYKTDRKTTTQYFIFRTEASQPACGILFATPWDLPNSPVTTNPTQRYFLILLDYDLDRTSDSELRAFSNLDTWPWNPSCRFPMGSTLCVMLVREDEHGSERVAVGKMFAAAWQSTEHPELTPESLDSFRDSGYAGSVTTTLDDSDNSKISPSGGEQCRVFATRQFEVS